MENKLIYQKLIAVMSAVKAIGKNGQNTLQNYKFRGIDDVLNELHEHFSTNGIFIMPEVIEERREQLVNHKGTVLLYSFLKVKYTFFAEDGSSVSAIGVGEAMDSGDKATNKAQSSALKYVLLQALLIPTEEPKDVENDSHELKAEKQNGQKSKTPEKLGGKLADKTTLQEVARLLDSIPEEFRDDAWRSIDQYRNILSINNANKAITKLGEMKANLEMSETPQ